MMAWDRRSVCRSGRPMRGSQLLPLFYGFNDFPQADHKIRLGVIVLPAAGFVELYEMGTTTLSQIAPPLGDLLGGRCCRSSLHGGITISDRLYLIIFS